ncbi:MAG: hypothetical protein J2P30_00555 [Actinobacteria bacterium]|nr:hypothetical protein [Actinomycetota bacterium]
MSDATPAGLCQCGCGQQTRISDRTDPRFGQVKGQPLRFIHGHARRGVVVTAETRAKLSEGQRGSKGNGWKGDQVSYSGLHRYLRKTYPKTGICEECGKHASRTDYALIKGRAYSRNREDYRELCHACHMRGDLGGRVFSPEARARIEAGQKRRWERYHRDKEAGNDDSLLP